MFSQAHPYEEAVEVLGRVSGIEGSVHSFRAVTLACGESMLEEREAMVRLVNETDAPLPQGEAPASLMLVGVDGCQVLRSAETVGRKKKGQKPRKKSKSKRGRRAGGKEMATRERGMEAKVGVMGVLRRRQGQKEYGVDKKSYVTTFAEVETFSDLMYVESLQRGVLQADEVVMMGDGAPWIWKRMASLYPQRVEILDWYHLSEKVWETAESLYGVRETGRARVWVKHPLDKLWNGQVEKVYRALQGQRQKWEEKGGNNAPALEAIETLERYLREHEERIDYPRYRKRGLPVGSGVIEGACKNVVGGRMKQSGMQWRKGSAEPVLHLRAEFLSGRWDKNWQRLRAIA